MVWTTFLETDFFNQDLPPLKRKQSAFAIQDHPGLWRIHWQLGQTTILSTFYTRIDQACLLWGLLTFVIFITAQFTAIDWGIQAMLGTGLTLSGTIGMIKLAAHCVAIKPLNQVVLAWAVLMGLGALITDLSILLGWGIILQQLCFLWLGLSGLGYLFTGLKMRSRAFFLVSLAHVFGIAILPYVSNWQYLFTGILIGLSVMLVAELQWDSSNVCAVHSMAIEPAMIPGYLDHS